MKYKSDIVQNDMKIIDNKMFLDVIDKNAKIMITGCNGMIATYLIYYLMYLNDMKEFNLKVYALSRNVNKSKEKFSDLLDRKDLEFIEHDVINQFDFDFTVDYVFHFAGSADPYNILNNPVKVIKANTIGTINALEYCVKNNIKKIIFPSTREVYGKVNENIEYLEENDLGIVDQLSVRACYPESKRMAECIINSYHLQYKINYNILRIAHCYGPGMPIENDGRIMSDLINNVVNNEDIVLKSDGSAVIGFCYLSDLVSAIMFICFLGEKNTVYNVCNEDENISVKDLANKLVGLFPEKKISVTYKEISQKEKEGYCKFKRVKMNTNRLRNLGWNPNIKLDIGLKNTVNSFEGDE